MPAMANTDAEPVCSVSHQMIANWAAELPKREIACPVQMVKKTAAQERTRVVIVVILTIR